jgi:hypothetical protein
VPTGSTPTGRHLRTSKKLSRGPHIRGPFPVEWKTAPVEAAQVSLLRWLRRQLRQPIPAREHLEAAVENDDVAEARRLLAGFEFSDEQRRNVEQLLDAWERQRAN